VSAAPAIHQPEASPVSSREPSGCDGVSTTKRWDDPAALRGEIHTGDRLAAHAAEIARAHGVPVSRRTPGPLRARLAAAKVRIDEAYEILSREVHAKSEPSPAEEWLLDNSHIVQDQLREIQEDLPSGYLVELPRIADGAMRDFPRVYGLCIDYLRHTDARVDLDTLASYTSAYQTVSQLTIGELWAIPIMLRLGLVMTVGALAASEASEHDRTRADAWAKRLIEHAHTSRSVTTTLDAFAKNDAPVTAALLVQLLRRLREHDVPLGAASRWVRRRCVAMHTTPEELSRKEHLRQAADQVSVGNAVTSMRTIGALGWNAFFERTSVVEEVLRRDPSAHYRAMDDATRDHYRRTIESLARRCAHGERAVAAAALELATRAHTEDESDEARAHIGYWLVDEGRVTLEREIRYRPRVRERVARIVLEHASRLYIFAIIATTFGMCAALWAPLRSLTLALLLAAPASELAVAVINAIAIAIVPPRLLPKMAFDKGVPAERRTLVVIPALIDSPATIGKLLESLEIRSLANAEKHFHFALLTDFVDHDAEHASADDALLELVTHGIEALNERHAKANEHRYILLHRHRVHCQTQDCFMGWERKRGKLEELNRLLRGAADTTFSVVSAPRELLEMVRYVITLDADTDLPREVGRKLVATMAHPLVTPHVDRARRCVLRGHAIVQPRVGTLPMSARTSHYAHVSAGPSGIDPYTTACSDVYQDLFGEGSFVGKGIYEVDAFAAVMDGRARVDRILSHDLFEGIHARCALASDIEVLDEEPASYAVAAGRAHRWIRGDWQLLPFLFRGDLRVVDAWRIVDNLRRSLVAPALVVACAIAWLSSALSAACATAMVVGLLVVPVIARAVLAAVRTASSRSASLTGVWGDLFSNTRQALVHGCFLLDSAIVSTDAIARTLYRLAISKRRLLEWTTTSQAARASDGGSAFARFHLLIGSLFAMTTWAAIATHTPAALAFATPVLVAWALAPAFAWWLSLPLRRDDLVGRLSAADRRYMRSIARKTWRFFEEFVTEGDHHLPPDNYQEAPRGVIAHRTSPTNMGLYLVSVVAARDFGFIALRDVESRLDQTLSTIERLERLEGHVLNWYDTTTLAPLQPRYVSTVDSGNLAAYLWTVHEACADLLTRPIAGAATLAALDDTLRLAGKPTRRILLRIRSAHESSIDLARTREQLDELHADTIALRDASHERDEESRDWLARAVHHLATTIAEIDMLAPFVALLSQVPDSVASTSAWSRASALLSRASSPRAILACHDEALDALSPLEDPFVVALRECIERARDACANLTGALAMIGARAAALADGMNFRFLFDEERELFSIGYNAQSARLDNAHYDLLASEARLGSLVAIAKGDAPQEHWFRLARPRAALASNRRVLLSWSGSMFEYLMPLLVSKSYDETLLAETYTSCVARQRAYGDERGVPWGISESAFNVMDLALTYQYRAFGVPGLGLKAGLADDLVVAPYATALAALVRPDLAAENFKALAAAGADGRFGFYEAIDYTPSHVPPNRRHVVVKTLMAHHQGMVLVALDNVLHEDVMQERFHRDARIKATALLLEERVPVRSPLAPTPASRMPTPSTADTDYDLVEHIGLRADPLTRLHVLGHGDLSTFVTAAGEGATTWRGIDVYRFREDRSLEAGGIYVYVRNHTAKKLWSAGFQPTKTEPSFYDAAFAVDRVAIARRDGDVETATEIVVSPEHAVEVRRFTFTNHGKAPCELDVTTYTEIVLASRDDDVAHRAFGSLFIETEVLRERGAVLARRRPKSPGEAETWVAQVLVADGEMWSGFEFDTSRASFVGRGRTLAHPTGLDATLIETVGAVLDPAIALRRKLTLKPGAHARLTLSTAIATSRAELLELVDTYATLQALPRTLELAWADARVELKHLGVNAAQSHRFQHLYSAVVFPHRSLRATPERASIRPRGRGALWAHGISGDLPILVLRIDDADFSELLREVLLAHEFWRLNGVLVDLVVLNEEHAGYMQPLQQDAVAVLRASPSGSRTDQRGGVFLRRAQDMVAEDRTLLLCAARVVLAASRGSLAHQLRRVTVETERLPAALVTTRKPQVPRTETPLRVALACDNGIGGFSRDGAEYVMALGPQTRTPLPWCNVMANASFGTLVSESGASCTWFGNAQRHRLTPWSNDSVSDPSGELFYVRDDEDGATWSLTPEPAGGSANYRVSHGQGFSRFDHTRRELEQELSMFVSPTDPVKICRVRIKNAGTRLAKVSLYGFVEWVLGRSRETTRTSIVTDWDATTSTLMATNPMSHFPERHAFFTSSGVVRSVTGDREEFFGVASSRRTPAALGRVALSGRVGVGLDPCAALHVPLRIEPGASVELAFVLGDAENLDHARALSQTYRAAGAATHTLEEATTVWRTLLGAVTVKTEDETFDALVNHWLLYQVTSSRLWGRTGFYQSSGAYGFRDQLQDVLALVHTRPDLSREHILRAAQRQFVEGDVQHWWHPASGEGVRTRCSDDMLWLPYVTAAYVRATGDASVLDESIAFLKERALTASDEDLFGTPAVSDERASLYEHCTRALDVGTTAGTHDLPLMGSGDWNDGMNRVGRLGKGESVWLAWFLGATLSDFTAIAEKRGDRERVQRCKDQIARLAKAVDTSGWDGAWYRRAFFDDGTPLGSSTNDECRIDAIAQSWAVISGIGDPARARDAVHASLTELVHPTARLMRLLWPPFDRTAHDPGYIRAYPNGVRENGGQYTHGVLWTVRALTMLGEGDAAMRLWSMIDPARHASSPEGVARYRVEPYVVAADVYEAKNHVGRGGWTWYTGSAGWMYRVALEDILGVRRVGDRIEIAPCIPRAWKRFEVSYGSVHVVVENPRGVERGIARFEIDGEASAARTAPLDGKKHEVLVVMG